MKLFQRSSDIEETNWHTEHAKRVRAQRAKFANQAGLEQLDRGDLTDVRSWLVHQPTGDLFTVYRGSIDAGPTHPVVAFYEAGDELVFLELLSAKRSKRLARR